MNAAAKRYSAVAAILVSTAIALSFFAHVPYIFTLLGFSAWALFGHIITADEDVPGGWSNPDGKHPFPWAELAIKAAIFAGLCAVVVVFPALRSLGA